MSNFEKTYFADTTISWIIKIRAERKFIIN
jgi:hypothetical protein